MGGARKKWDDSFKKNRPEAGNVVIGVGNSYPKFDDVNSHTRGIGGGSALRASPNEKKGCSEGVRVGERQENDQSMAIHG